MKLALIPIFIVLVDQATKWLVIKRIHYKPAPGLVAARNRLHPPTDLRQNRGERPRSLPTAPTINQGLPMGWLVRKQLTQVLGKILGHHCRTNPASFECS